MEKLLPAHRILHQDRLQRKCTDRNQHMLYITKIIIPLRYNNRISAEHIKKSWKGERDQKTQHYTCQHRPRPHKKALYNWKVAIWTTYELHCSMELPCNKRLGVWIPESKVMDGNTPHKKTGYTIKPPRADNHTTCSSNYKGGPVTEDSPFQRQHPLHIPWRTSSSKNHNKSNDI